MLKSGGIYLKKIIIALAFLVGIVGGIVYYLNSGRKIINKDIPVNSSLNIKEIEKITKDCINEIWKNNTYHIGDIIINLDEDLKGSIELWYADENRNKEDVPNIITVNVDTKANKIVSIIKQERNSKIEPELIELEQWNTDIKEVIEKAKEAFLLEGDTHFQHIYISNSYLGEEKRPVWSITCFDIIEQKGYSIDIDVYTGEQLNPKIHN